jgi:hypothetical protein
MGFLDKIFGSKEKSTALLEPPPCPHTVLLPRWDSVDDIGNEEKATFYVCEGCSENFTPAEAVQLRETAAERLRADLIDDSTPYSS